MEVVGSDSSVSLLFCASVTAYLILGGNLKNISRSKRVQIGPERWTDYLVTKLAKNTVNTRNGKSPHIIQNVSAISISGDSGNPAGVRPKFLY